MLHARVCVVAMLMLLPGCALMKSDGSESPSLSLLHWGKGRSADEIDSAPVLPMARLEASIASRPENDMRVRQLIWKELDESGLMSPDNRQRLNQSGFRVGVAGSATPWALQSLAKEATAASRTSESQQPLAMQTQDGVDALGPSFSVMQGGKSLLEVQSQLDPQRIPFSEIPDLASLRDRSGLRCVFEVSVKELNDDWALLSFLPQLHAGAVTTRLAIDGISSQLPVRQNIIPLYDQQFTVKLHTGEVAVIGRHETDDWNPGRLFFKPESGSSASERLLMIRFSGVEKVRGQRDPSFRVGAYDK
jgi:hypothetical protein